MNNIDKIRNMTLDEMAEFLKVGDCYYCKTENWCDDYDNCKDALKQWLQQESD